MSRHVKVPNQNPIYLCVSCRRENRAIVNINLNFLKQTLSINQQKDGLRRCSLRPFVKLAMVGPTIAALPQRDADRRTDERTTSQRGWKRRRGKRREVRKREEMQNRGKGRKQRDSWHSRARRRRRPTDGRLLVSIGLTG